MCIFALSITLLRKSCAGEEKGESRLSGGFLHLLFLGYGEAGGGGETNPKL